MSTTPDTELELLAYEGGPALRFRHWCARGLQHSLEPIEGGVVRWRSPSGKLHSRRRPGRRKYRVSVDCGGDVQPPDFGGVWEGLVLTVRSAEELSTAADRPSERPMVPGSARTVTGSDGVAVTFYRPELVMQVTGWRVSRDEWGAVSSWSLQLEEV